MKYYFKKIISCYRTNQWIVLGFPSVENASIKIKYNKTNVNLIDKIINLGVTKKEIKENKLLSQIFKLNLLTNTEDQRPKDDINRNSLFIDYINSIDYQHSKLDLDQIVKSKNILILGCGAGSSMQCYQLAQFGFQNITIIDFDIIGFSDILRIPIWRISDVNKKKVIVLKELIYNNFNINIKAIDKSCTSRVLKKLLDQNKFDLVINGMDPSKGFHLEVGRLCKGYCVAHFSMSYSYHLVKIGPMVIPNKTIDEEYIENYNKQRIQSSEDFYPSFNFNRIHPEYFIHPSVNFNILILAGIAFKEILFFLINKEELVDSLGSVLVYAPITNEIILNDLSRLK